MMVFVGHKSHGWCQRGELGIREVSSVVGPTRGSWDGRRLRWGRQTSLEEIWAGRRADNEH